MQNHKKWNISEDVFCIELKLFTVLILITKFHDMAHCDVSIAMQWAPGPLHPKGKIPNKGYLLLMFIQWVRANKL